MWHADSGQLGWLRLRAARRAAARGGEAAGMSASVRLERSVFEISRAADFFSVAALRTQTGVSENLWTAMCLKETADNGLDASEAQGIAPEIGITLERDGGDLRLSVSDNGPGMTPELVSRILNFTTRTSTNLRRRAPTRGALGNALKTIVGLPYALGSEAPIVIESLGVRHEFGSASPSSMTLNRDTSRRRNPPQPARP